TRVLARSSAARRHFIWSLAIAGVLALPVIEATLPWTWEVLPGLERVDARAGGVAADERAPDEGASEDEERQALAGEDAAVELATDELATSAVSPVAPATTTPRSGGPVATAAADAGAPATAGLPDDVLAPPRLSTAARVGLAWAAVAGLLLLYQVVGRLALSALARRAAPVTEPAFRRTQAAVAAELGLRREVRLLRSARSRIPMTWGVRRPVVLLPRDSEDWTRERIRVVLQHELAHVSRMDAFTQGLGRLACALHWFNPLAWWAVARMGAESEQAADDMVLRGGARASDYAGHLLELVASLGPRSAPAGALPLAQRSRFEGRLVAILDPARERAGMGRAGAAGLAAGVLAVVTLLGAAAPATPRSIDVAAPSAPPLMQPGGGEGGEMAGSPAAALPGEDDVTREAEPTRQDHAASDAGAVAEDGADAEDPATRPDDAGDNEGTGSSSSPRPLRLPVKNGGSAEELPVYDSASVAALVRALREDADEEVRRTAAWALGQLEDRMATPALIQALRQDESVEVRRTAVWALGQIEDPAAAPALGEALEDADVEVRRTALWALGQIESPQAVGPLSRALQDPEPEVRRQAAWALGQIESREAVGPLTAALDDASAQVREQVIWALGQIEDAASAAAIAAALSDESAGVRRQAAWALGQIESEAAVDGLVAALAGDEDEDVRRQSAWALGQIEADEAVPGLAAALSDPDPEVARTAAWAIGQIEPATAPPRLVEVARTATGELRRTALWALAQIEDPAAVP
ncbi:MAG TPA: M56 family metallopeptidase, partial [Thermoanaerobaculia bacterium]